MEKRYCLLALGALLVLVGTGPARAEKATLVFTGDTAFGESYRIRPGLQAPLLGDNRYLPSMKALVPLLGGAREILVNLETPLALPNDSAPLGKDYIHWASPEKAAAALKAAGVTAVGLANNHTMDQGSKGLEETLATLGKAGIAPGGAGPRLEAAEKPLLWRVHLGKGTTPVAVFFLGSNTGGTTTSSSISTPGRIPPGSSPSTR